MSQEEYIAVTCYEADSVISEHIKRIRGQEKLLDMGMGYEVTLCRYRDMVKGGCTVYPVRPLICRLLGHVEWMPCPIEKVPLTVETADALELMNEYAQTERHSFEEWDEIVKEQGAAQ